ncbi:ATP-binding protein, partial [Streptomyces montanus]
APQQRPAAEEHAPPPLDDSAARTAEETARRLGAFARGTRHGRAALDDVPDLSGTPHADEGNTRG